MKQYYRNTWRFVLVFACIVLIPGALAAKKIPSIKNKKIYNLISKQLYGYGGAMAYGLSAKRGAKLVHKLIGFYTVPSPKIEKKLIIASSNLGHGNDCHACAPKISFFIFKLEHNLWVLDKSYINAHSMGQWGDAPSHDAYQVVKLADDDDTIGLFLKVGGTGQGVVEDYIYLYTFGKNSVKVIFHEQVGMDDGGTGRPSKYSWKAKFRFKRGKSSYYDIILHKKGIEDGKHIDSESVFVLNVGKYLPRSISADTHALEQKKSIEIPRKRFASVPLRDHYRATVSLDKNSFKFELSGYGDTLNLAFTDKRLTSSHIYGPMAECKRVGEEKLVDCEDVIATSNSAHGTLHYRYDGDYYDVLVEFADYHPSYKEHFYNDDKYMYWDSYKNGKVGTREKFKIDRVYP